MTVLGVAGVVAVAATATAADEQPDRRELRESPAVEEVRLIHASWFDDGYESFVRNWTVPRRHWPSILQAVSDCQQEKNRRRDKSLSNYLHLRVVTTDGRSLLIISQRTNGDLKAFPYRGCKDSFLFARNAAPELRDRLGKVFRIAVEEKRANPRK